MNYWLGMNENKLIHNINETVNCSKEDTDIILLMNEDTMQSLLGSNFMIKNDETKNWQYMGKDIIVKNLLFGEIKIYREYTFEF